MEHGKYQPKFNSIDLVDVIKWLKAGFVDMMKWYDIKFRLSFKNKSSYWDYIIVWDKKWIYSLFSNLVKNAIEHSDRWKTVHVNFDQTDEDTIKISIHNNQAVPKEIRDKLLIEKYVSFWKLWWTWLWLYSAKLITESHNWKIAIKTCDSKGTIVSVRLKTLWKAIE
jgi:nitrogen fixation/metabolism regulation signal transduction histidine kinase